MLTVTPFPRASLRNLSSAVSGKSSFERRTPTIFDPPCRSPPPSFAMGCREEVPGRTKTIWTPMMMTTTTTMRTNFRLASFRRGSGEGGRPTRPASTPFGQSFARSRRSRWTSGRGSRVRSSGRTVPPPATPTTGRGRASARSSCSDFGCRWRRSWRRSCPTCSQSSSA